MKGRPYGMLAVLTAHSLCPHFAPGTDPGHLNSNIMFSKNSICKGRNPEAIRFEARKVKCSRKVLSHLVKGHFSLQDQPPFLFCGIFRVVIVTAHA